MSTQQKLKPDVIEAALTEGRIPPIERELWQNRFEADPEGTKRKLKRLPRNILFESIGIGPEDYEDRARTRIEQDSQLRKYTYVLLDDWNGYGPSRYLNPVHHDEAYDHFMWILNAETKDLIEWAKNRTTEYCEQWVQYSENIQKELGNIHKLGSGLVRTKIEELLSFGRKSLVKLRLGDAAGYQREARYLLDIYGQNKVSRTMVEKRPPFVRSRPVDSWAARYPLLYQALPALEAAKIIDRTQNGFNWKRKQVLFLWLLITADSDFNEWAGVVRFFTIQGKQKTSVQLRNAYQKLPSRKSVGWYEIEAILKSLPNCK
jgi:hypothetical protein